MSMPAAALGDGDVDRRLRIVDRALGDEIKWTAFRRILAEIHFEIMITSQSLELSASETAYGFSVEFAQEVCNILSGIVRGARDWLRRGDGGDAKFRGRNYEPFIHKNLGANGMVDRHEREIIVVIDFPQFRGYTNVVV